MNILTIDMDFLSGNYLKGDVTRLLGPKPTEHYWDTVLDVAGVTRCTMPENKHNLLFMFNIFTYLMKEGQRNVVFGVHHDSILNHIDMESTEEINIVNIDHHHDISYLPTQTTGGSKYGECTEGNWTVPIEHRIKEYTWVRNTSSELFNGTTSYTYNSCLLEEAPNLKAITWDLVYIALSPNYTLDTHWFYFYLMVDMYSTFTGMEVEIDTKRFTTELTKFI